MKLRSSSLRTSFNLWFRSISELYSSGKFLMTGQMNWFFWEKRQQWIHLISTIPMVVVEQYLLVGPRCICLPKPNTYWGWVDDENPRHIRPFANVLRLPEQFRKRCLATKKIFTIHFLSDSFQKLLLRFDIKYNWAEINSLV